MVKRILVVALLSIMIFQGTAFAQGSDGEIVFRDTLYGAVIGALIGATLYAIDSDDASEKIGGGVLLGTFGGLFFGLYETRSFAEIENGNVKFAVPLPAVQQTGNGTQYSASLLKAKF